MVLWQLHGLSTQLTLIGSEDRHLYARADLNITAHLFQCVNPQQTRYFEQVNVQSVLFSSLRWSEISRKIDEVLMFAMPLSDGDRPLVFYGCYQGQSWTGIWMQMPHYTSNKDGCMTCHQNVSNNKSVSTCSKRPYLKVVWEASKPDLPQRTLSLASLSLSVMNHSTTNNCSHFKTLSPPTHSWYTNWLYT